METVNGEFIMQGCAPGAKERLRKIEDLYALIKQIGFIPLFANKITGFSVEERVTAEQWWTGDKKTDPWEWRQIASVHPDIAYGKFFDRKAGFISKEWFPVFANYRRDGYDFDALYEDGFASLKSKHIMDAFEPDDESVGQALLTNDIRHKAGFGKRSDKSGGEKGFDGALTALQMQTYLIVSDFRQKKNKKGQEYGWHIAAYETPETKWGRDVVTSGYNESLEVSWGKIASHMKSIFQEATEADIKKLLGIRHPGITAEPERESKQQPEKRPSQPNRLPYPESLITEIGLAYVFGEDKYTPFSDDQQAGLEYALSLIPEKEQDILKFRYEEHFTLRQVGDRLGICGSRVGQIIKKALRRLRHPTRANFYKNGYEATLNSMEEAKRKIKAINSTDVNVIIEQLGDRGQTKVYDMGLSVRTANCLARAWISDLKELVKAVYTSTDALFRVRNMGVKSAKEVLEYMEGQGLKIPEYYINLLEDDIGW